MKLLSCNVRGRIQPTLGRQLNAVLARKPDVLALQEVTSGTYAHWCRGLWDAGYSVVASMNEGPLSSPLCFGGTERACERWSPAGMDAGGAPAGWGVLANPMGRGRGGDGVERCPSLYRFINFEDLV